MFWSKPIILSKLDLKESCDMALRDNGYMYVHVTVDNEKQRRGYTWKVGSSKRARERLSKLSCGVAVFKVDVIFIVGVVISLIMPTVSNWNLEQVRHVLQSFYRFLWFDLLNNWIMEQSWEEMSV